MPCAFFSTGAYGGNLYTHVPRFAGGIPAGYWPFKAFIPSNDKYEEHRRARPVTSPTFPNSGLCGHSPVGQYVMASGGRSMDRT